MSVPDREVTAEVADRDLSQYEPIARAMAEWSSDKPWDERHPKNCNHWLLVAEAVMSNHDAVVEPILIHVRARKDGQDPVVALDSLRGSPPATDEELNTTMTICPKCHGRGEHHTGLPPGGPQRQQCDRCDGLGEVPCPDVERASRQERPALHHYVPDFRLISTEDLREELLARDRDLAELAALSRQEKC